MLSLLLLQGSEIGDHWLSSAAPDLVIWLHLSRHFFSISFRFFCCFCRNVKAIVLVHFSSWTIYVLSIQVPNLKYKKFKISKILMLKFESVNLVMFNFENHSL